MQFPLLLFLAVLVLSLAAFAAEPLPTFTLQERLHRHWPAQPVHYDVDGLPQGAVMPEGTVVVDDAGTAHPCQWSGTALHPDGSVQAGAVWFVTGLPADATRNYRLAAGKATAPVNAVATMHDGDIMLDGGAVAVKLGSLGRIRMAWPQPLAKLPAPIQAVRLPNGAWAGRGWLAGDVPIMKMETTVTANGPLFAEATVSYVMATGKHYTVRVRVDAGSPVALIEEEFSLPAAQDATTSREQAEPTDGGKIPLFCFSLRDGLNPDTARYRGYASTPARCTVQKPDGSHEGVYTLDTTKRERHWSLLGWMSWWPDAGAYYTVYRQADDANGPVLGFMRMFSGRWLNPTGIQVWSDPTEGLYLAAPLGITHRRDWDVDGVHDSELTSDVYSGSMPPETPNDLGRRCWALYTSAKGKAQTIDGSMENAGPNRAMVDRGEFTLDKVKTWTLDWARTPVVHPRLHTPPEQAAQYPSTATAAQIDALIKQQQDLTRSLLDGNGVLGQRTHFFFYMINARETALDADLLLASPQMTTAQRDELCTQLAFSASVLADRDYFPINTGFHIGNPNMPLALESGMTLLGCLMPDHPQAAAWAMRGVMKFSGAFDKYVHPESGAWNECPHYMYDASLRQMFEAMFALRYSGYGDLFDRPSVKRLLDYCIGIMPPPDARFGIRIIPTQGNTSLEGCTPLAWAAAAYANTDPDLSARLQWMWKEDGSQYQYKGSKEIIQPDLPAKAPASHSTWYKGFGAILRNGFPDVNETYMAYRQGPWMSHYEDGDQGSWHLYAKGAPLSLDFGSQYGPIMGRPWLHNRISVDHKIDPMLEHTHDIDTFTTLGAADFVSGQAIIDTLYPVSETPYHPMVQLPNAAPSAPETIPPLAWRRSILFVKDKDMLGPNYFLVRDSFAGAMKPTDWSAWCLANDVAFDGNIARFRGQFDVDLDVVALTPAAPAWVQNHEPVPPPPSVAKLSYGTGVPGWPQEYREPAQAHAPVMAHNFLYLGEFWKKVNGNKVFEERQICARLGQPAGDGYLMILYPRKRDAEPIPTYAAWANGLGAKLTLLAETHYVLLAPSAVQVKDGDIAMDAAIAVVRQGKERTIFSLLNGRMLRAGKYEVQATAPVTLDIIAGEIHGETNGPAQTLTITLPRDGTITIDGQPTGKTVKKVATITVPSGEHRFVIR